MNNFSIKKQKNGSKIEVRKMINIPIVREGKKFVGTFISFTFDSNELEHFAIALGNWKNEPIPTVRIHSECMTGDVFGSERCDCGQQLTESIELISEAGGFVLYLRQEGRGIGLFNKFDAYGLQDKGYNTYEANKLLGFEYDLRSFTVAAEMLKALDREEIYLHSNNKDKKDQLTSNGIKVSRIINTKVYENPINKDYLLAKKDISGHSLKLNNNNKL